MITVHTEVKIADGKAVQVELYYDPEDPAAVVFTFENHDGTVAEWTFGRDLLKEALEVGESGTCDVLFTLVGNEVKMGMVSPKAKGHVMFPEEIISEFVELIYEEVPNTEDEYEIPEYVPEEWLV
jgi:hypothetical protein